MELQHLLQPGTHINGEIFNAPEPYAGQDANKMTVGGVYWRSAQHQKYALGEQIAIEILPKRTLFTLHFLTVSSPRKRLRSCETACTYS